MAVGSQPVARDRGARRGAPAAAQGLLPRTWQLAKGTAGLCLRYRVTGLAAEAGFFALLALPPLVLGLTATAAWVGQSFGVAASDQLVTGVQDVVGRFLTPAVVDQVVLPTLQDALARPRVDLISLGYLLAVWSGSRAVNVYVDTIAIMYGLGGRRGIVRTRVLSLALYLLTLGLGAFTVPLVLVGPTLLSRWLPSGLDRLVDLYWPVVLVGGVLLLATLYHISTPVRGRWVRDLPGAVLALVSWVAVSALLRLVVTAAVGGTSIYGPLTAAIVVLIWLYTLALAVLIGAGLNAASDQVWPSADRARAREELGDVTPEGLEDAARQRAQA